MRLFRESGNRRWSRARDWGSPESNSLVEEDQPRQQTESPEKKQEDQQGVISLKPREVKVLQSSEWSMVATDFVRSSQRKTENCLLDLMTLSSEFLRSVGLPMPMYFFFLVFEMKKLSYTSRKKLNQGEITETWTGWGQFLVWSFTVLVPVTAHWVHEPPLPSQGPHDLQEVQDSIHRWHSRNICWLITWTTQTFLPDMYSSPPQELAVLTHVLPQGPES